MSPLDYHMLPTPGKIEVCPTKKCETRMDLSMAYSPGVAEPCLSIQKNPADSYKYTSRGNLVGVISNGTATITGASGTAALPVPSDYRAVPEDRYGKKIRKYNGGVI